MNEENKQPLEEEEQAPEAQAQEAQQPQAEAAAEGEKEEKNAKAKKKKEKGITFTREQVEQMGTGCQAAGVREGPVRAPHC